MADPFPKYVAEMGARLFRAIPDDKPVHFPVNSVLSGRRNNPPQPDKGIRSLAVYGPIHYQELPELFMDYICSLTGKSPSTTGAGSEGALTKGPFNALRPAADLNAALVAMALTGLHGFSSAAGHIGPNHRFDHDISLLIPEVWCRVSPDERDPRYLIENELLEPVGDYEFNGETVPVPEIGLPGDFAFRPRGISLACLTVRTKCLTNPFCVRKLRTPHRLWTASNRSWKRTSALPNATSKMAPSMNAALRSRPSCTSWPLANSKAVTNETPRSERCSHPRPIIASDWYQERLDSKQQRDVDLWKRHIDYLEHALRNPERIEPELRETVSQRQTQAVEHGSFVASPEYRASLVGTIGRQPF